MGDNGLLQEFAASRSEAAFAAVVRQHVNLVFATAYRQLGNHGLAEEVTQSVFVALARRAGSLGRHPTVTGWLHKATLLECRRVLRTELRRQRCEQVAIAVGTVSAAGESVWASLVPLLDDALLELNEKDRLAVLLRFLEEKPLREVGEALGASEDAAQKRVARALIQMTDFFRQRGFAVPALTASAPLFAAAMQAAPAGLANTVVVASLAGATTSSTLTILSIMATSTKLKIGAAAIAAIAIVVTPVVLQQKAISRLSLENARLTQAQEDNDRLQKENQILANLKIDHDEMERLRRQNEELLRLRWQLGVAKGVLADNTRQLEDARSQLNESLERAAKFGDTNVITEVEAAAIQHLSIVTKTEMLRKTLQALIDVAQTNQTGWQLDATQLTPEGEARLKALESAFDFDVVYRGPLNQLQDPGRTIVIRQRQAEQRTDGTYTRIYGFGDGHVEIHKTPDGNFEDWERERIVPVGR